MMRKFYFLVVLPLILLGCSKNDEPAEPKETWILHSFEFYLDKDDDSFYDEEVYSFPVVKNDSDQQIIVDIPFVKEDELENSFRYCYDGESFPYEVKRQWGDCPFLPIDIQEGEIVYGLNRGEFLPEKLQTFPYNAIINTISRTGTLGPHCMQEVTNTVIYRNITTSYRITFEIIPSGKITEITGKWNGKYVDHIVSTVVISSME